MIMCSIGAAGILLSVAGVAFAVRSLIRWFRKRNEPEILTTEKLLKMKEKENK